MTGLSPEAWQRGSWPAMTPGLAYGPDEIFAYAQLGDPLAGPALERTGYVEYLEAVAQHPELLTDPMEPLPQSPRGVTE